MSSSERPVAGYQVGTSFDLVRWQLGELRRMCLRSSSQKLAWCFPSFSGVIELITFSFNPLDSSKKERTTSFQLFLWIPRGGLYGLTCHRKQTASSHIINLEPVFILKNFHLKHALGGTGYISFTPSPLLLFSLDNVMNFISLHFNTSFVFLLARRGYLADAKGVLLTTVRTTNGFNLSWLAHNCFCILFQWVSGCFGHWSLGFRD